MRSLFRQAAEARRDGRPDDAEAAYRTWLALEPESPLPKYGLATLLLARSQWKEGWDMYEARADIPQTGVVKPQMPMPEWRGQAVKSLLVCPEQGFGDQIMFARFIPELVAMGIDVTLVTPAPLVRLFGSLGCRVVAAHPALRLKKTDAWCLIGSLPRILGTLPTAPYLPGAEGGFGVGVMAAGNPLHVNDANRSLPPARRAELLALGRDLSPDATGAADFEDTAEIIRGLASVVSVDTSVVHLAGAMGKPCSVLLSRKGLDWRWGDGIRSPWYPQMRLVEIHHALTSQPE